MNEIFLYYIDCLFNKKYLNEKKVNNVYYRDTKNNDIIRDILNNSVITKIINTNMDAVDIFDYINFLHGEFSPIIIEWIIFVNKQLRKSPFYCKSNTMGINNEDIENLMYYLETVELLYDIIKPLYGNILYDTKATKNTNIFYAAIGGDLISSYIVIKRNIKNIYGMYKKIMNEDNSNIYDIILFFRYNYNTEIPFYEFPYVVKEHKNYKYIKQIVSVVNNRFINKIKNNLPTYDLMREYNRFYMSEAVKKETDENYKDKIDFFKFTI